MVWVWICLVYGLGFVNNSILIKLNAIGERFDGNRSLPNTVHIKTIRYANAVAVFLIFTCTYTESMTSSLHSESVKNPKTVRLPYNVTEEELAIALETLPFINAGSVVWSMGLHGQHSSPRIRQRTAQSSC